MPARLPPISSILRAIRGPMKWGIAIVALGVLTLWCIGLRTKLAFEYRSIYHAAVTPDSFTVGCAGETARRRGDQMRAIFPKMGHIWTDLEQYGFPPHCALHYDTRDNWKLTLSPWFLFPPLATITAFAWRPRWFIRRIPAWLRWGSAAMLVPLLALAIAGSMTETDLVFGRTQISLGKGVLGESILGEGVLAISHGITDAGIDWQKWNDWSRLRSWGSRRSLWGASDPRGFTVCIATTWPFFAVLAISGTLWLTDLAARRHARSLNLCPRCRYDRTGLTSQSLCPECGHALPLTCSSDSAAPSSSLSTP